MTCERFGVEPVPVRANDKVGIAPDVRTGARPINAIRHLPVGDTAGWYIWGGDIEASEQRDDFFVPLHVAHLAKWAPEIVPYLALPPGYGVIVKVGYEDVWFDSTYAIE